VVEPPRLLMELLLMKTQADSDLAASRDQQRFFTI
jgi:hypothetical protein